MAKANIDGDIICYRCGFSAEHDERYVAIGRCDALINSILDACNTDEYEVFLTAQGKSNYRFEIDPEYKANRLNQPKPRHYLALREHLIKAHRATVVHDMEADDALGIAQTSDSILCSIDKDLKQIPGSHYDFVKRIRYEITEDEALRFFYKQVLMGDKTDNISGLYGIGPKKADKIIGKLRNDKGLFNVAYKAYQSHGKTIDDLIKTAQLVKIRRKEGESLWVPPVDVKEQDNTDQD